MAIGHRPSFGPHAPFRHEAPVFAEQAVFTSLTRRGKSGYHVVARSAGLSESEASTLATWSPSHGGLMVDGSNRASVNFYPLPSGRFVLSRTREGRTEYSGRGGKQLYTHALILDAAKLRQAGFQPLAVYRDALALGYFHYQDDPAPVLRPVELSSLYPRRNGDATAPAFSRDLGMPAVDSIDARLDAGQPVVYPYAGDRLALAEFLIGRLPPDTVMRMSFSTSLHPSSVRPYRLTLVAPGP
jgi:hypothetical protein